MSAVDDRTMTAADVLAAVQALAPSISARAAEIEAARRLPADLLDELKDGRRVPADPAAPATEAWVPSSSPRCTPSKRSPPPTRPPPGR